MMKYLSGDKKESQDPVAIADPKTKPVIIAPKDIKLDGVGPVDNRPSTD